MKPITVWERYNDPTKTWGHNHIENGHSGSDTPLAHTADQAQGWKKGKWKATHVYLDQNNIVVK